MTDQSGALPPARLVPAAPGSVLAAALEVVRLAKAGVLVEDPAPLVNAIEALRIAVERASIASSALDRVDGLDPAAVSGLSPRRRPIPPDVIVPGPDAP